MRRYLVVANQTLGGEQLTAKLADCSVGRGGLDGGVVPGLPHRVRRATKLPVTHSSGPAGPSL